LEHRFIASMTAHSITNCQSSKWPYAGANARSPSIALSTALCWRPCQKSYISSTLWTHNWYTRCWTKQ